MSTERHPLQSRDRCARRPHAPTENRVARSPRAPAYARRDRRSRPEAAQRLLPKLAVSYVPIDELRPAPRRVRRAQAAQSRDSPSIEKFGVCQPILVDKDGTIVHGHRVVEAARAPGLTEIPVIFVEHLSPTEQRLLSITLDRLGEMGQWDEAALRIEFAELIDLGEDVVVSGFEAAEIDFLLLDDEFNDGVGELDQLAVRQEGRLAPATSGSSVATAFCRPTPAIRRATNA